MKLRLKRVLRTAVLVGLMRPVFPARAQIIVVDPAQRQQTFEAWGTSLCWFGILADRDWRTRITKSSATGDVPHGDTPVDVNFAEQTVTFNCDVNLNRVKVTARTRSWWGLGAAVGGPDALPPGTAATLPQDALNRFDMNDDGDVDLADVAAFQAFASDVP